ncbi:MAG: COX15/CtaA family protein [Gemmatimonadota bacterium]
MTMSQVPATGSGGAPDRSDDEVRRRFAVLASIAALYTYALIVFGGIVRITGSGMGCGEDWPRCNGEWIPAFDFETLIEYGHRLLAAGLVVPIALVAVLAWRNRTRAGFAGRGGAFRPVLAVLALLTVQVALGAITVRLELPATTTVLHFVTASLLLAALLVAVVRIALARDGVGGGGVDGAAAASTGASRGGGATDAARWRRSAYVGAGLGLLAVAFGAMTANTGAASLCQGFPLCNGEWMPAGGTYVHIHWTHRLVAFALFFHVAGAAYVAWRAPAPPEIRTASGISLALVTVQLVVAAALVLLQLPQWLQALHLAVGTALWGALAVWAAVAAGRPAASPGGLAPAAGAPSPSSVEGVAPSARNRL